MSQVLRGIGGLLSKNVGASNFSNVSLDNLSASAFIAAGEVSGNCRGLRRGLRMGKYKPNQYCRNSPAEELHSSFGNNPRKSRKNIHILSPTYSRCLGDSTLQSAGTALALDYSPPEFPMRMIGRHLPTAGLPFYRSVPDLKSFRSSTIPTEQISAIPQKFCRT